MFSQHIQNKHCAADLIIWKGPEISLIKFMLSVFCINQYRARIKRVWDWKTCLESCLELHTYVLPFRGSCDHHIWLRSPKLVWMGKALSGLPPCKAWKSSYKLCKKISALRFLALAYDTDGRPNTDGWPKMLCELKVKSERKQEEGRTEFHDQPL